MEKLVYSRKDLFQRGIRISNTTLLKLEKQGKFPRRRYLSPRTVVWSAAAIDGNLQCGSTIGRDEGDE